MSERTPFPRSVGHGAKSDKDCERQGRRFVSPVILTYSYNLSEVLPKAALASALDRQTFADLFYEGWLTGSPTSMSGVSYSISSVTIYNGRSVTFLLIVFFCSVGRKATDIGSSVSCYSFNVESFVLCRMLLISLRLRQV